MTLAPGTHLGPYRITAPLGAGGMGEVFRATDSRLGRDVAVKVLPQHLSANPEVRARFEREAKTVSSLNHPHICTLFDVGREGDTDYLVMELVEGETLAQRLERGALPGPEVLKLGGQIADALDRAHRAGVIHRDLKPGNVMLTRSGAKLMDFGLARSAGLAGPAMGSGVTVAAISKSPTVAQALTAEGTIVGTFQYMAPEQLEGKESDARGDLWALGCVLYEMATGRRAFDGTSQASLITSIMGSQPAPITQLAPLAPAGLDRLIHACLAKDPADRLQSAHDIRIQLAWLAEEGSQAGAPAPGATRPRRAPVILATAVVIAVLAFAATRWFLPPEAAKSERVARVSIALPTGVELGSAELLPVAISRDGTRVAFVGARDGKNQIYIRRLEDRAAKAIEGTEGGDGPFFSPDGQWIGFFAGSKLRKIAVGGAAMQTLADAPSHRGGAWSDDGYVYFVPSNIGGIWRVPEAGGAVEEVTHLNAAAGEISHRWPHRIAGTSTLLFSVWTGPGEDEHHIATHAIESKEHRLILQGGDAPQYALNPGLLLYAHRGELLTVPWRPSKTDLGKAVPVASGEHPNDAIGNEGCGNYVVSDEGTLIYLTGGQSRNAMRLVWIDRAGALTPLQLPVRAYENVAISPDGSRAAIQIREGITRLWIYDFERGTLTPVGTGAGSSQAPLWTADGRRLIYRATRQGTRNLFWVPVDGSGEEERLTTKPGVIQTPASLSSDGRVLLFNENGPQEPQGSGTYVLPLDGDRTPHRLFPLPAPGQNGHLSPDGRWVAYESIVSSRMEVFVSPYSGSSERRLISTAGGTEPLWSRDGRELFFQSGTRLMSVQVTPAATFMASAPRVVHEGRFLATVNGNTSYSITKDGGRFLRIQPIDQELATTRIELVLNWFPELKRPAAGGGD